MTYSGMFVIVTVIEHLSHPTHLAPIETPFGAFFGDVDPTPCFEYIHDGVSESTSEHDVAIIIISPVAP